MMMPMPILVSTSSGGVIIGGFPLKIVEEQSFCPPVVVVVVWVCNVCCVALGCLLSLLFVWDMREMILDLQQNGHLIF